MVCVFLPFVYMHETRRIFVCLWLLHAIRHFQIERRRIPFQSLLVVLRWDHEAVVPQFMDMGGSMLDPHKFALS